MRDGYISARAKRVWLRFSQYYGARFTEQFGPQPTEPWCELIDSAKDDELQNALISLRQTHLQHPPTLPEFDAALCKVREPKIDDKPDVRYQLVEYIIGLYRSGLLDVTWKQIQDRTWIVRFFDAIGPDKKMIKNWGAEFMGVILGADGDRPSHRIMVSDMQLSGANEAEPFN